MINTGRGSARAGAAGFTLMELMITVVIVAILASIAMASYRNYVLRANRVAAQSFLREVASLQERFLLDNRAYATSLAQLGSTTPSEVSGNYTVTVTNTAGTTPNYTISAAPTTAQAQDNCDTLTLNNLGSKGAAASGCWR